jgi:hypothetical protein
MQLRKVDPKKCTQNYDGKITWKVANFYSEEDGRILLMKSLGK